MTTIWVIFIMFIDVLAFLGACGPNAYHKHGENHQRGQGTCLGSHLCKVVLSVPYLFNYSTHVSMVSGHDLMEF